jgi:large subunit ribosomal protein L24e
MKCSFCNNEIAKGSGTMYVKISGQLLYFCSSKCEKNLLKLGRIPREHKWTAVHTKGAVTKEEDKQKK